MSKENENRWAAMLGFAMSDPEGVKAGYALAALSDDPDIRAMADSFAQQALALGVSEEELENSLDAMLATNKFFESLDEMIEDDLHGDNA